MWNPNLPKSSSPLYLNIVKALQEDIDNGQLKPGDRLPTHRELARNLDVAIGTITRAYSEAERRGLIQGEIGRGTFIHQKHQSTSLGTPDQTPPQIIELSVDLPIHQEDPDLGLALRRLVNRGNLSHLLRYHAHAGTIPHRQAGVDWAARFGISAKPENVLICAGTQHALNISLLTVTEPGDWLLADRLTYPGLKAVAEQLHLRLEGLPMDEQGMLPDALESACKQRKVRAVYTVPSYHNPTTAQLPLDRRQAIAEIAEKYDVAIIEDDVHRLLSETPPPPISSMVPHRGYYIASLSKAVTGGLRVAYLIAPPQMIDRLSESIWATNWMVPSLNAEIAAMWIEDGTADSVVARKRAEAGARQRVAAEIMNGHSYQSQPNGYYLWLQLPDPWTTTEFAFESRRRGVAVTPSTAFSVGGRDAPAAVRVCIGAAEDRNLLERGLLQLRGTLESRPGVGRPMPH